MTDFSTVNFDTMTSAEFENYLPELFGQSLDPAGGEVSISKDPRLAKFFAANPVCAQLVGDLETIAETAKGLFEPVHDPSDAVWDKIAGKLNTEPPEDE